MKAVDKLAPTHCISSKWCKTKPLSFTNIELLAEAEAGDQPCQTRDAQPPTKAAQVSMPSTAAHLSLRSFISRSGQHSDRLASYTPRKAWFHFFWCKIVSTRRRKWCEFSEALPGLWIDALQDGRDSNMSQKAGAYSSSWEHRWSCLFTSH